MVAGLLFKWEDSPALHHHCGFCERPLSHPGARASCFGTHAEPCHRYHQAMFMRLRGHTCNYCRTIDKAHHRRHKKIAEYVRNVYESCGLVDWTIIPSEELEERGRGRESRPGLADSEDTDRNLLPDDTPASKRERKDARCLARAASRTRVVGQDEIDYVDSVMHSVEGVSGSEENGPCNTEEMDEIASHLRYTAHIFNSRHDRRNLRKFVRLPDVDVDFDAEMERILEAFRVIELLKRNTRNRGLLGKELKIFEAIVGELRKAIVEDLVSVKQDVLETRMRRAGYLRYTNKAAHSIIEDRYTDKDWKTGEKYLSNTSNTSDTGFPDEEASLSPTTPHQTPSELPPKGSNPVPDRRHLEKIHKRVNGEDGLRQVVIEPYHAPLLSMPARVNACKPAVQLKVVTNGQPQPAGGASWQTVIHPKKPTMPSVKPSWGQIAAEHAVVAPPPPANPWGSDAFEIPDLRSLGAPAVQAPAEVAVTKSKGQDRFIDAGDIAVEEAAVGHAAVSQKKAKKHEREARRKAKKTSEQEEPVVATADPVEKKPAVSQRIPGLTITTHAKPKVVLVDDPARKLAVTSVDIEATVRITEALVEPTGPFLPAPIPTIYNSKHMHWTKFQRQFIVDQLTSPLLKAWTGCSHGTSCVFEIHDVPDCPFHEPHCACVDPLHDECYLVYPCNQILSSGPYNRLRGEKLLAMYQKDEHFRGRIMLVDNDMIQFFMLEPKKRMLYHNTQHVPKRLATEYNDFADGYNPGPLMEQEKQFERLWHKNNIIKSQLSMDMLSAIHHEKFETAKTPFMCYCRDVMPDVRSSKNIVECAHRDCTLRFFHKSCVKKLGVEKVSRWYCTRCEHQMRALANHTLRTLGYDDIPDEIEEFNKTMGMIKKKLNIPEAEMEHVRTRLEEVGGGAKLASIMAMRMCETI